MTQREIAVGPIIIIGGIILVAILLVVVIMCGLKKKKPVAGADVYRSLLGANAAASPGQPSPRPAGTPQVEALRQNLRVKLLHQEDKIDAAIAFERERNPAASEEQLMKAAIERWERDNR